MIPHAFNSDHEMDVALILGIIAIQMVYCPFDYEDWS